MTPNPSEKPESEDSYPSLTRSKGDSSPFPKSIILVLAALGAVIVEESGFLILHYLGSGSISIPDALVFGCAIIIVIGILSRNGSAWRFGRTLCWIAIVFGGITLGVTIRGVQAGTTPVWALGMLIVNLLLLGSVYHGLGLPSAREYLRVSDTNPQRVSEDGS